MDADCATNYPTHRPADDGIQVFAYDGSSIFPGVRLSNPDSDGEELVQIRERKISVRSEHTYDTAKEALHAGKALGCRVRGLFVLCGSDGWEGWDVFGEMICGSYDDAHKVCIEVSDATRHRARDVISQG
eukprot:903071-Rhodomonas_salina.1